MRDLKIKLEQVVGQIFDFTVVVQSKVVIDGEDGSEARSYEGKIPDERVRITVWVTGIPGSKYVATVDLPGKANDFSATYTLGTSLQKIDFHA
jgi:hypothetical protein